MVEVNDEYQIRCRHEPTRWPLAVETALNPDVPDFQPGKVWKKEPEESTSRRKKPTKKKEKKEQAQVVPAERPARKDNREELEFQFDEELPSEPTKLSTRRRTTSLTLDLHDEKFDCSFSSTLIFIFFFFFSSSSFSKNEESDFELDDDDIDKILIITPTPPSHRKQTREHTPRARMTNEMAKIIEDGLKWYEEELWHDRPQPTTKTIERIAMKNQRKINSQQEVEDTITPDVSETAQPRSSAIAIVQSEPQVEPFYRPKPIPSDPSQSLPTTIPSELTSITEVNDNQYPEEPRTPHSRAKHVARFYPVTKDAPVVKADVIVFDSLRLIRRVFRF